MNLTAFGSPTSGNFPRLSDELARGLIRHAVRRVSALAAQHGLDLPPIDDAALARPMRGLHGWSAEWSAVRLGLKPDASRDEVRWLVAQCALAAHVSGLTSSAFELSLAGTRPLFLGGRALAGEQRRVHADAGAITVTDEISGRVGRFASVGGDGLEPRWVADAGDVLRFGRGHAIVFSDGQWMQHWTGGTVERGDQPEASRRALADAAAVLESELPLFYLWTSLLLREVVPIPRPDGNYTASRSAPNWGGQIQLSPATVVDTIVMLLHECSHQYFHLALSYGPVTTRDAPEVYSVLKSRNRPLDRVLLGYHAFGIAVLALRTLRDRQVLLDQALDSTIAHLERLVRELDGSLRTHQQYLQPSGASIYAGLHEQLAGMGDGQPS